MTDTLPDNVDLRWIGKAIIALRRDVRGLRDDIGVMAAILRRVENNQTSDRRGRVETLEEK
jgi:hypothetical protein